MAFSFTGSDNSGLARPFTSGHTVLTVFAHAAWGPGGDSQGELLNWNNVVGIRLNGGPGSVWQAFYRRAADWLVTNGTVILTKDSKFRTYAYTVNPGNATERIYLDGQQDGSNIATDSINWLGVNFNIGEHGSSPSFDFAGGVAEVAIWLRDLTNNEQDLLSRGYSPLHFPEAIHAYWPLRGDGNDLIGGNHFELWKEATPTWDHPKIIYPTRQEILDVLGPLFDADGQPPPPAIRRHQHLLVR